MYGALRNELRLIESRGWGEGEEKEGRGLSFLGPQMMPPLSG